MALEPTNNRLVNAFMKERMTRQLKARTPSGRPQEGPREREGGQVKKAAGDLTVSRGATRCALCHRYVHGCAHIPGAVAQWSHGKLLWL